MTREDKVKISIQKAIDAGYVHLCYGIGSQSEKLEEYRSQGYDVKGWYTSYKKDNMSYVMYGKMKGQVKGQTSIRDISEPVIDRVEELKEEYSDMNVKTLRKICSEKKIAGYSKMNKQQIVEVLAAC